MKSETISTPCITQMENDLKTLFYRLVLEDKNTHSPETLEVMERLTQEYRRTAMTKKNAIKKSIQKWKDIRFKGGKDMGANNCELCKKYLGLGCFGCPVFEKTKTKFCYKTPYQEWENHGVNYHPSRKSIVLVPGCKECERLADEEIKWLEDLYQNQGE